MNKIFAYNRRFLQHFPVCDGEVLEKPVDVPNKHQQLLSYIFARDPVTGMIQGDIAMFANPNVNPEIKRFIEENLLVENSSGSSSPLNLPADISNKYRGVITDDDIVRFSRNHDEDVDSYAQRMRAYLDDERAKVAQKKEFERVKKLIDEANKAS